MVVLGGLFIVSLHCVFCHVHALVDQVRIEEADCKNWGKRWDVLEFLSVTVLLVTSMQVLCKMTKRKRKERTLVVWSGFMFYGCLRVGLLDPAWRIRSDSIASFEVESLLSEQTFATQGC